LTEIQPFRLYLEEAPKRLEERHNLRLPIAIAAQAFGILTGLTGGCSPVLAATQTASVNANATKPLVLTKLQDLNLGTVTLAPGSWGNATVSLSRAGVLSCSSANLVCSGATAAAKYNIQGSNRMTVRVSAPSVTMVNQSDTTKTLTLVTDAPATVVLTSSGSPGDDFSIGGSVTVNSATQAGVYVGTFAVTVDY
jgi:hypothetical protein